MSSRTLPRSTILQKIRAFRRDHRAVAAVEFALVLPFMMLLYLGTAELTYGLMANRKMTMVSRGLSDLIAQTPANSTVTNTDFDTVFSAATRIMSPYSSTPLRMSVSSMEFISNGATPPVYTARTMWTAVYTSGSTLLGTARPCGASAITKVSNTTKPSSTTLPEGLYGVGTVIVADVSYDYRPPFGAALLAWSSTDSTITFRHTSYMKPRAMDRIEYTTSGTVTGRTKCTYT